MYLQLHKIVAGFSKGRSSPVLVLWQPVSLVQVCEQERCVRTGVNSCCVLPAVTADVAWSKRKRARGNTLTEINPCGLTASEVPLNGKQEASCSSGSCTSPELLPRCHGSLAKSTHPPRGGRIPSAFWGGMLHASTTCSSPGWGDQAMPRSSFPRCAGEATEQSSGSLGSCNGISLVQS